MIKEALISLQSFCKLIIFSLLILFVGCHQKKAISEKDISIIWKDDRATGLSISMSGLDNIPEDSFHTQVEVRLANPGEQPAISGNYIIHKNEVIFEPLIPFTRGLRYNVFIQHKLFGEVEIAKSTQRPELLAIYPSQDSVPENLLKIYLVFSRPMVEGHSLQYVSLLDQKGDTLPHIFLNLQSELWNAERTVLTLWLDPGRIKRDLQPNRLLGPPLVNGRQYKLIVSDEWPDEQGATLMKGYIKNFVATLRDTNSPAPQDWKLKVPKKNTTQSFEVDLYEPLDYILLHNTIRLFDSEGNIVNGSTVITDGEKKYSFIPAKPWTPGLYKLQIEARLEDLAGNNLNRLFDRDLKSTKALSSPKMVFEREWQIN